MHLALLLVLSAFNIMHVGQVAEYYLSVDNNELQIKFVIEKEELLHFNFNNDCDFQEMTSLCLFNYFASNLVIKINGNKLKIDLGDSYTEHGHLIVFLKANLKDDLIDEINIENSCFYEYDPHYKNRMIINIKGFNQSYLLSKDKNSIHLK